jgi:outer membrane lipoprotein-sorting protein
MHITAHPKNDKLAFDTISMLIAPDNAILEVTVTGKDLSTMKYRLENEQLNVPVPETMFKFTPPAGTKIANIDN